jgi:hypothetical protein
MTGEDVRGLMRRAVADNDAGAMRRAFELLVGDGPEALSPEAEYETRSPDYVMEMPQSGERIVGRDARRAMQEAYPKPPSIALRRVTGAARVWVVEGVNDYGGGDVWHVVVVWELDADGRVERDTRYYAKPFDPPAWRAAHVQTG